MNTPSTISLATATSNWELTRTEAIQKAVKEGYTVNKYSDPTEGARTNLGEGEACDIAWIDIGLIYFVPAV